MDNLKKILPIRNYALRDPLVVVFNIHQTHHNAFGNLHYNRVRDTLISKEGANLDPKSVHLLPNLTNLDTSIESRGSSMAQRLQRLLERLGVDKCHLVAHSFAGVDARAAISLYGADRHVSSLTTVSSPHLGMRLIDKAQDGHLDSPNFINMERIFEILGITRDAALEFSSHNIGCFNVVAEDSPDTRYYSIGSKKNGRTMSALLRNGHEIVVDDVMGIQCDGFV
jgi:pimeloyl-ACP methyl ester carboxylesterase